MMPRIRPLLFSAAALALAGLVCGWALAQTGPARPATLRVLSATDHDLYTRAFAAADSGNWTSARTLAAGGSDPLPRRILEWRYARDPASGASFAEIDAALKASADFPGRASLYARGEQALAPDTDASTVLAWFGTRSPATAIGKIRLGDALIVQGGAPATRGQALVRAGWTDGSFDPATELSIEAKNRVYFTPADERVRLAAMLWRGDASGAQRQMARVDAVSRAVAQARIALASGIDRAKPMLAAVEGSDDPDLLFDWSRMLRLTSQDAAAHAMLLRIPASAMTKDHATRWAQECAIQARDALAAGDPRTAFALISHAGLTSGDAFADQQFLAGFIALRALKAPTDALAYFQRLDAAVSRPISKARAQFWIGRSYEALGSSAEAAIHYRLAAAYPETFYGQLALAHLSPAPLLHLNAVSLAAAPQSEIDTDPLIPAMKVLAELGQTGLLRQFVTADIASATPGHIRRLLEEALAWGYPEMGVRLGKELSYAGYPLPEFTHPVMVLPPYGGPGTAAPPALVLGLIRQETEFDPYAVSSAGALGIMQVMPATAKRSAKTAGLPYRPDDVLRDANYNMALGMVEFAGHYNNFGGSTVLAIAAYNAGPGNVRKWLAANGDPRSPSVDPVDWIEEIPFGETRNYVQRVLENEGAYRDRLAGKDMPLMILNDLYAPGTPPDMAAPKL